MRDIRMELVYKQPIDYCGLKIYQPTFDEIYNYGFDKYNAMVSIYAYTLEVLEIPEEEIFENDLDIFKDFIMKSPDLFTLFLDSLVFFCKINPDEDSIIADENRESLKISNKSKGLNLVFDRWSFPEFSQLILEICVREKAKPEAVPNFNTEEGRENWEILKRERKKREKKNTLQYWDVYNIIQNCGNGYVTDEVIGTMTMFKMMTRYRSIMGIDSWDTTFKVFLASGDNKELEDKHWSEVTRIRNNLNN